MFVLQNYMEARYYLEDAILKSCSRENKLNIFVSENSKVLLCKINAKEHISEYELPNILTLSEMLDISKNFTFKSKVNSKYERAKFNRSKTLYKKKKKINK